MAAANQLPKATCGAPSPKEVWHQLHHPATANPKVPNYCHGLIFHPCSNIILFALSSIKTIHIWSPCLFTCGFGGVACYFFC
jgi:hypothetical protein